VRITSQKNKVVKQSAVTLFMSLVSMSFDNMFFTESYFLIFIDNFWLVTECFSTKSGSIKYEFYLIIDCLIKKFFSEICLIWFLFVCFLNS